MPQLKLFGRLWGISSDDLPIPVILGSLAHTAQAALTTFGLIQLTRGKLSRFEICEDSQLYTIVFGSLAALLVLLTSVEIVIAIEGLKGSIMQEHKRKRMPYLVVLYLIISFLHFGFAVAGTVVVARFPLGDNCGIELSEYLFHPRDIFMGNLVLTWITIALIVAGVIFTLHFGSLREWKLRLALLSLFACQYNNITQIKDEQGISLLNRLASSLHHVLDHIPLVGSDVVVGLWLVMQKQQMIRRCHALQALEAYDKGEVEDGNVPRLLTPSSDCIPSKDGSDKTICGCTIGAFSQNPTQLSPMELANIQCGPLTRETTVSADDQYDAALYGRYAMAAYGWMIYQMKEGTGSGLLMLGAGVRSPQCFSWIPGLNPFKKAFEQRQQRQLKSMTRSVNESTTTTPIAGTRKTVHRKTGAMPTGKVVQDLQEESIRRLAGLSKHELLYVNHDNELVSDQPYFIALNAELKQVIVSIRGSLSLSDVLTDLVYESESLEGWWDGYSANMLPTQSFSANNHASSNKRNGPQNEGAGSGPGARGPSSSNLSEGGRSSSGGGLGGGQGENAASNGTNGTPNGGTYANSVNTNQMSQSVGHGLQQNGLLAQGNSQRDAEQSVVLSRVSEHDECEVGPSVDGQRHGGAAERGSVDARSSARKSLPDNHQSLGMGALAVGQDAVHCGRVSVVEQQKCAGGCSSREAGGLTNGEQEQEQGPTKLPEQQAAESSDLYGERERQEFAPTGGAGEIVAVGEQPQDVSQSKLQVDNICARGVYKQSTENGNQSRLTYSSTGANGAVPTSKILTTTDMEEYAVGGSYMLHQTASSAGVDQHRQMCNNDLQFTWEGMNASHTSDVSMTQEQAQAMETQARKRWIADATFTLTNSDISASQIATRHSMHVAASGTLSYMLTTPAPTRAAQHASSTLQRSRSEPVIIDMEQLDLQVLANGSSRTREGRKPRAQGSAMVTQPQKCVTSELDASWVHKRSVSAECVAIGHPKRRPLWQQYFEWKLHNMQRGNDAQQCQTALLGFNATSNELYAWTQSASFDGLMTSMMGSDGVQQLDEKRSGGVDRSSDGSDPLRLTSSSGCGGNKLLGTVGNISFGTTSLFYSVASDDVEYQLYEQSSSNSPAGLTTETIQVSDGSTHGTQAMYATLQTTTSAHRTPSSLAPTQHDSVLSTEHNTVSSYARPTRSVQGSRQAGVLISSQSSAPEHPSAHTDAHQPMRASFTSNRGTKGLFPRLRNLVSSHQHISHRPIPSAMRPSQAQQAHRGAPKPRVGNVTSDLYDPFLPLPCVLSSSTEQLNQGADQGPHQAVHQGGASGVMSGLFQGTDERPVPDIAARGGKLKCFVTQGLEPQLSVAGSAGLTSDGYVCSAFESSVSGDFAQAESCLGLSDLAFSQAEDELSTKGPSVPTGTQRSEARGYAGDEESGSASQGGFVGAAGARAKDPLLGGAVGKRGDAQGKDDDGKVVFLNLNIGPHSQDIDTFERQASGMDSSRDEIQLLQQLEHIRDAIDIMDTDDQQQQHYQKHNHLTLGQTSAQNRAPTDALPSANALRQLNAERQRLSESTEKVLGWDVSSVKYQQQQYSALQQMSNTKSYDDTAFQSSATAGGSAFRQDWPSALASGHTTDIIPQTLFVQQKNAETTAQQGADPLYSHALLQKLLLVALHVLSAAGHGSAAASSTPSALGLFPQSLSARMSLKHPVSVPAHHTSAEHVAGSIAHINSHVLQRKLHRLLFVKQLRYTTIGVATLLHSLVTRQSERPRGGANGAATQAVQHRSSLSDALSQLSWFQSELMSSELTGDHHHVEALVQGSKDFTTPMSSFHKNVQDALLQSNASASTTRSGSVESKSTKSNQSAQYHALQQTTSSSSLLFQSADSAWGQDIDPQDLEKGLASDKKLATGFGVNDSGKAQANSSYVSLLVRMGALAAQRLVVMPIRHGGTGVGTRQPSEASHEVKVQTEASEQGSSDQGAQLSEVAVELEQSVDRGQAPQQGEQVAQPPRESTESRGEPQQHDLASSISQFSDISVSFKPPAGVEHQKPQDLVSSASGSTRVSSGVMRDSSSSSGTNTFYQRGFKGSSPSIAEVALSALKSHKFQEESSSRAGQRQVDMAQTKDSGVSLAESLNSMFKRVNNDYETGAQDDSSTQGRVYGHAHRGMIACARAVYTDLQRHGILQQLYDKNTPVDNSLKGRISRISNLGNKNTNLSAFDRWSAIQSIVKKPIFEDRWGSGSDTTSAKSMAYTRQLVRQLSAQQGTSFERQEDVRRSVSLALGESVDTPTLSPFTDGSAGLGMVADEETDFIDEDFSDWQLVITGHSLGAGVAALLALKLRQQPEFSGLKCWSFSPPTGLLSPDVSKFMEPYCTTVGIAKESIVRLSVQTMDKLRDDIVDALLTCNLSKTTLLLRGLVGRGIYKPQELFTTVDKLSPEVKQQLHAYEESVAQLMAEPNHRLERSFRCPGRVMYIRVLKKAGKRRKRKFVPVWIGKDAFPEEGILLSSRLWLDHLPHYLSYVLKSMLADQIDTGTIAPAVSQSLAHRVLSIPEEPETLESSDNDEPVALPVGVNDV